MRKIGAVLAGVLASAVIVTIVELISSAIYPLPAGIDIHDKKALADAVRTLPDGALILVLAGWFLGMLAASWIAAAIAHNRVTGAVAGVLVFLAALYTMAMLPHPSWFKGAVVAAFLVAVTAGARLGSRPRATAPA